MQNTNKEMTKRRNEMFKSIMSNPKLARTFNEAISAPIGSTKREQAKAVLSIMKKMGNKQPDGQGGFWGDLGASVSSGISSMFGGGQSSPTPPPANNFNNMRIFPAAPTFKTTTSTPAVMPTPAPAVPKVAPITQKGIMYPQATWGDGSNVYANPVATPTWNGKPWLPGTPTPGSTTTPKVAPVDHSQTFDEKGNVIAVNGKNVAPASSPYNPATIAEDLKPGQKHQGVIEAVKDLPGAAWDLTKAIGKGAYKYGVKPLANAVALPVGAAISAVPALGSLAESAYKSGKTLLTGWNDPSEFTSPAETKSWKAVQGFTSEAPWTKYWANLMGGTKTPAPVVKTDGTVATTTPATTATTTPATTATTTPATVVPAADPVVNADGSTSTINTDGSTTVVSSTGTTTVIPPVVTQTGGTTGGTVGGTTGGTVGGTTASPTGAFPNVASAVAAGTGPVAFGQDYAKSQFGGELGPHLLSDKERLSDEYNIENLKANMDEAIARGDTLVPTLKNFMKGKDKDLRNIDKELKTLEDSMMDLDMSNPAVAASYKGQRDYLYTLKGMKEQTYGAYLNAAVTDYNADLKLIQANYETVYGQFSQALSDNAAIDQQTYNDLMARGADMYTQLENAPIRANNLIVSNAAAAEAYKSLLATAGAGGAPTSDKDYFEHKDEIIKQYGKKIKDPAGGDDLVTFDTSKLLGKGLYGLYQTASYAEKNPAAVTEAIGQMMNYSIKVDPDSLSEMKKLIYDLSMVNDPQAQELATDLTITLEGSASAPLESFVSSNLPAVQAAIKAMASKGYIGNRAGFIKDKTTSTLSASFLGQLYDSVIYQLNQNPKYKTDPTLLINQLTTPRIIAQVLTSSPYQE